MDRRLAAQLVDATDRVWGIAEEGPYLEGELNIPRLGGEGCQQVSMPVPVQGTAA